MSNVPNTPGYLGGKSAQGPNSPGRWIVTLIPWERDTCYIEPFAGMLGVLLQRAPVAQEIVNDLDGDVVNWWRVVREQPDALDYAIRHTPHSRAEHADARALISSGEGSPLARALAFTTLLKQSLGGGTSAGWAALYHPPSGKRPDPAIHALAERMRRVQLEQRMRSRCSRGLRGKSAP